jgi:ketosteroid isomerase-like protein
VQSEQALRKFGEVDRELIEQRLHMQFELRAKGDWRGWLEFAAEDISFDIRGNWAVFPYAKPIQGKKALAEALMMVVVQFENLGWVINDLVIDGDRVGLRRTVMVRNRGTGRIAELDVAEFIRFRDGLIVEFTEIVDSAALAKLDRPDEP